MKKQNQRSGNNSTNIQADEITIHQGASVSEVRQIALDIFRANFLELSAVAREVATRRAEEITEMFLERLMAQHPEGMAHANDPDFQSSLFTIQKEHAKAGQAALAALLVDLLVDRSKCRERDVLQIVLNESLAVAPKLTAGQITALGLIFVLRYTKKVHIVNHEQLGAHLDSVVEPFVAGHANHDSAFQHLQYSGCGSVSVGSANLSSCLRSSYPQLFTLGFSLADLEAQELPPGLPPGLFRPCLNDAASLQLAVPSTESLRAIAEQYGLDAAQAGKLNALFDRNPMNDAAIQGKVTEIRPYMERVFESWQSGSMKSFALTSVGIAIGHANIKRRCGEFADIRIWIN